MWVVCILLLWLSHVCLQPSQLQWPVLPVLLRNQSMTPWAYSWVVSALRPNACFQPVCWGCGTIKMKSTSLTFALTGFCWLVRLTEQMPIPRPSVMSEAKLVWVWLSFVFSREKLILEWHWFLLGLLTRCDIAGATLKGLLLRGADWMGQMHKKVWGWGT